MSWKSCVLAVLAAIMLQCSFSGYSGGGVIGNPSGFSLLSYTDTLHGRVVTTHDSILSAWAAQLGLVKPSGQDSAHINEGQRYSYPGLPEDMRFRFSDRLGSRVSAWSPDSSVAWIWTTAGICSVQVQMTNGNDTSGWSKALIVRTIE
ncbi:MAG TPA: hypothetical protein VLX68_06060 [Chitinivibrionales bacterium]|nr:hypothetical protein [Chitinivibrionales bacterium]